MDLSEAVERDADNRVGRPVLLYPEIGKSIQQSLEGHSPITLAIKLVVVTFTAASSHGQDFRFGQPIRASYVLAPRARPHLRPERR